MAGTAVYPLFSHNLDIGHEAGPRPRGTITRTGISHNGFKTLATMTSSHAPEYQQMVTRLVQARKAAGLTQMQVAERLGKPQSYVSKVERAERRIDPVELARFAAIYGRSVTHFLADLTDSLYNA